MLVFFPPASLNADIRNQYLRHPAETATPVQSPPYENPRDATPEVRAALPSPKSQGPQAALPMQIHAALKGAATGAKAAGRKGQRSRAPKGLKLFPSGRRFAQDVKLGVGVPSQNTYTVRNGNRNFHKGEVRFTALSYPVYREARQELW
jgi:hypothetical protein